MKVRHPDGPSTWRCIPACFALALVSISAVAGDSVTRPQESAQGCEPGADVTVSARVVSITEQESRALVVIQLTIDPLVNVLESRVRATIRHRLRRGRSPAIPERILPLAAGLRRHLLYEVNLAVGKNHDILFTVERQDSGEPIPGATAWVRVPLNAGTLPVEMGGLIQYRARAESN